MSIANLLNHTTSRGDARPETETVELHWVAGCYTYFGWFPWSDFEGESLGEDRLEQLTAWRRNPIVPIEEASSPAVPAPDKRRSRS